MCSIQLYLWITFVQALNREKEARQFRKRKKIIFCVWKDSESVARAKDHCSRFRMYPHMMTFIKDEENRLMCNERSSISCESTKYFSFVQCTRRAPNSMLIDTVFIMVFVTVQHFFFFIFILLGSIQRAFNSRSAQRTLF